jgi:hypothetical protein
VYVLLAVEYEELLPNRVYILFSLALIVVVAIPSHLTATGTSG